MYKQADEGSADLSSGHVQSACGRECAILSTKFDTPEARDPLYLFACHLEWRDKRNLAAYQQLLAALDDPDNGIRAVAQDLLHRSSPRPQPGETNVEIW